MDDNDEVLTKDLQKQIDHSCWDSKIYGTDEILEIRKSLESLDQSEVK